jgi:signal transduction histidine kinase
MVLKGNIKELNLRKQIIEAQSEELQLINSTKNRLFSIIAHDLRSPLSSLKGVMGLIDDESISQQEFKELSKLIAQNVDNLSGMLENLLLWSLSQMEGIKPNIAPVELNFIIDETVLIFNHSSMQKQINLTNNSATNLRALGDEYQIKTVLRNLINNAIKFTPSQGQIDINSTIKGQFVHLKITDSGVGIERNDLVQIFSNPKIKAGTAGEKGTGFGLFLCKELIEKNGGSIEIDSEFGKGTTVDILLPLVVN